MAYELTGLGSLGTVGAAASTGASAGGSAGGGVSTTAAVSAAADAAGGILDSIFGAVRDIRLMRQQQQAGATASDWSASAWLDETLYGRQAETIAREEARAEQGIQSQMGTQRTQAEADIRRQTAQLRLSQQQQEISSRIGGQYGTSRSFPAWAWVGIGVGGIGLTLLVVWLMARRG